MLFKLPETSGNSETIQPFKPFSNVCESQMCLKVNEFAFIHEAFVLVISAAKLVLV